MFEHNYKESEKEQTKYLFDRWAAELAYMDPPLSLEEYRSKALSGNESQGKREKEKSKEEIEKTMNKIRKMRMLQMEREGSE